MSLLLLVIFFVGCSEKLESKKQEVSSTIVTEERKSDYQDFVERFQTYQNFDVSLVNKLTGETFDNKVIPNVTPTKMFNVGDFTCFIYKLNCIAGGFCNYFYLSVFDSKEKFQSSIMMGKNEGDATSDYTFTYQISSDKGISCNQLFELTDEEGEEVLEQKEDKFTLRVINTGEIIKKVN